VAYGNYWRFDERWIPAYREGSIFIPFTDNRKGKIEDREEARYMASGLADAIRDSFRIRYL
jgi:hypothetical protein